ncbi:MAG: protein kinase [Myxococcota bacterium]|nr:protein kinase [Myxococcota bacterium]
MTEDADKNRIGEVIGGRYRLDHLLGKGGQGHVFAATDLRDGEQVAVKTLSGPKAEEPEWRERMAREARAMVSLVGTSAVRVLDQKWSDRGELCLILERLHGRDFEDYLAEVESRNKQLPLAQVVDLLTPVARTLESAHAAGILHRDIKPSNIFITKTGEVRLLDFGFAKFVSLRGLTRVGHVAGSPSYIAPEAWGGQPDTLDARVDVYGLAAVVFRALAARPPFQAAKVYDLYRMVTEAKRPSLRQFRPDLPPDIDDWVEQSLAIDPNHRFSQIRALWNALSGIVARASVAPESQTTRPDNPPRTPSRSLDESDSSVPVVLSSADAVSLSESLEKSKPDAAPESEPLPDTVASSELVPPEPLDAAKAEASEEPAPESVPILLLDSKVVSKGSEGEPRSGTTLKADLPPDSAIPDTELSPPMSFPIPTSEPAPKSAPAPKSESSPKSGPGGPPEPPANSARNPPVSAKSEPPPRSK